MASEQVNQDEKTIYQENISVTTAAEILPDVSLPPPSAPPDGGFWAWSATIGGHLVLMDTWGLNSSFGVFQTYYMQEYNWSPDDTSWIGSLQIFFLFFIGTFAGRLTDAGYFRAVFLCGTIMTSLGIFMASVSKTYWQFVLSQGVCSGIGNGLLFTPAVAIVGTYFKEKRALAFGITATGTATGGLIFPSMARQLVPRVGLAWTLRSMGMLQVATLSLALLLLRPRLAPRRTGPFVDWAAFKDLAYTFFACAMFCNFLGMYFAFYYVAAFARSQLTPGMTYVSSLNLLLVVNGVGFVGRITPNMFADRYLGPMTLMIPFSLTCSICLFAWTAVSSARGLYAWSVIYGLAAGGLQSLFPAALTKLTIDPQKTGIMMGMVCTANSIAALIGPPITGAIIKASGSRYVGAQIFAGFAMILGSACFIAARIVVGRRTGLGWRVKV